MNHEAILGSKVKDGVASGARGASGNQGLPEEGLGCP